MELIKVFLGILILFSVIEGGVMFLEFIERPKAVKKIGKRRYYVKWSNENGRSER